MQNLTISFNKKLLLAFGVMTIGFLWFSYYLYTGRDTVKLPYKYQFLFRSTLNAAIFIGLSGLFCLGVVFKRLFLIPTPIRLDHEGFMDHRYLKAPIPLHHIVGFRLEHKMVYGYKMDFLIIVLKQGARSQIKTNLAFMTSWAYSTKKDRFIALDLNGLNKDDYEDCAYQFSKWAFRNASRDPVTQTAVKTYKQPPLFS